MPVTVDNDTDFRRKEWVTFGSNDETPCTCFTVPGGRINVSLVDAPARSHESIEPTTVPTGPFQTHLAVTQARFENFKYRGLINGRTADFVPASTGFRIVDHNRVKVERWILRDAGASPGFVSDGTMMLFVYEFHNQATLRFELLFFREILAAENAPTPTLGFSITGATHLRQLVVYNVSDPAFLMAGYAPTTMDDADGFYAEGCLPLETATMRADRIAGRANAEVTTQSAQMIHPLYALVKHPTWGIWDVPPLGAPEVTSTHRDVDFQIAASGDGGDRRVPSSHMGYITHKLVNGQGAQPEYGAWTHVYNEMGGGLPVSDVDSRSIWPQHMAAMRHANRPAWFTDANGEPLEPTAANVYPNAIIWMEQIHWASAAPNRYRRTRSGNSAGDWVGADNEHFGYNCLAADWLLTGSFAARHLLLMMRAPLASHALGADVWRNGRGVGRFALLAAQIYRTTGSTVVLDHFADNIWPIVYARWLVMCAPTDPFRPFHFKRGSDFPGSFDPNIWLWISWHDSIMVMGLDAVLRMDTLAGFLTVGQRAQMVEVQLACAQAVVNLSFAPAHACGANGSFPDGRVHVDVTMGTGGIPVCPTLVAADYCERFQPTNMNRLVSFQTDIVPSWHSPCILIAKRIDPALAARCDIIMAQIRPVILAHNPGGNVRGEVQLQGLGTS